MLNGQFCGSFHINLMKKTCHLKEITNRNVKALFFFTALDSKMRINLEIGESTCILTGLPLGKYLKI